MLSTQGKEDEFFLGRAPPPRTAIEDGSKLKEGTTPASKMVGTILINLLLHFAHC
jgi:hypothetical protein